MTDRDKILAAMGQILDAVADSVKSSGPLGLPGGTIYAAMMEKGASLAQYESIMTVLVQSGRVQRRGELYFVGKA